MSKRREIEGTALNLNAKFILPMVNINRKHLPNNFINSYITDDYQVIIIYDLNDKDPRFIHYLDFIKGCEHFNKVEENEDELCIFFNIDEKNRRDFDMFKHGHYSKFTEEYKETICKFHGRESIEKDYKVTIYNTIYPQEFKKNQIVERLYDKIDKKQGLRILEEVGEVLDKPDLDKEIYKTIEQLKKQ